MTRQPTGLARIAAADDLTPAKSKKLAVLRKRHAWLAAHSRNDFDSAEVSALGWALGIVEAHVQAQRRQRNAFLTATRLRHQLRPYFTTEGTPDA